MSIPRSDIMTLSRPIIMSYTPKLLVMYKSHLVHAKSCSLGIVKGALHFIPVVKAPVSVDYTVFDLTLLSLNF
jgi:hypothetical protein